MPDKPQSARKIWLCGGGGFVGGVLAGKLVDSGSTVRVLSRDAGRHPDYDIVQSDYTGQDLARHFAAGDTVVNLIGILNESGFSGSGFRQAHVQTTRAICRAAESAGASRYLHMSALHASADGPSHYLASKAEAETVVRESGLAYTIFRPSVIFGEHDSFTNRFAGLIRLAPFVLPLACAQSRFQPISVEDVADCFAQSLSMPETVGAEYDLCGPDVFTLQEIVEQIAAAAGRKRRILPLNPALSRLQASILQFVPGKPFTLDNYRSLQIDSVCVSGDPLPFRLEMRKLIDSMNSYLG